MGVHINQLHLRKDGGVDLQHHPQGIRAAPKAATLQIKAPAHNQAHRLHLLQPHHLKATRTPFSTQAANLGGELANGLQAHTEYGDSKTFGHLKGDRKPEPDSFLKKQTGTMGN